MQSSTRTLTQARASQTLLPLLLFPLVVPVLLASVKATGLVILGDPMGQLRAWTMLLGTFDLIPASEMSMEFIIADGKGNKVFTKRAAASAALSNTKLEVAKIGSLCSPSAVR